jgi:hypothetical protein
MYQLVTDIGDYDVIRMMRASKDLLTCWAVGEAWKRPFTGRTLFSLQRIGLQVQATDYWALKIAHPPSYSDLVRDALEKTGLGRHALIVPSGVFATPGFAGAVDMCLETIRLGNAQAVPLSLIPEERRSVMLVRGIAPGQSTGDFYKIDGLREYLTARFPRALEKTTTLLAGGGSVPRYLIEQGRDTFQDLKQDDQRIALERPLDQLSPEALRAVTPGWVFQCNTEGVCERISEAHGCDMLVAVASGIKPWHFANELRHNLKCLILLDVSLPQLRFAFEAFEAIGEAPSWSVICQLPGYSFMRDEVSQAWHDEIYKKICAGRNEWHFKTIFLRCDLLTQTFRLVEFIKAHRPRKLLFWYSNIFHPFFGQRFSEDHSKVEMSFVRLMRQEFPGVLLYNSHREPAPESR